MRSLLFSGVPNQPRPKTHPVRLYLEELESRCLLSASHPLPVAVAQPTPVVAFSAPMINPGNINPGQNFVVPMNNPALNALNTNAALNNANLNSLANTLVNSNNLANGFNNVNNLTNPLGNSTNSTTTSETVNPNNTLQLVVFFSPNAIALASLNQTFLSWLGYIQNAETPPQPAVPGNPNPGQGTLGFGFGAGLPRQIIPAGNPNALYEGEEPALKEAIPGAEPPPALVPDAWFPAGPESFPEQKEEPNAQPLLNLEPIQQTSDSRLVQDNTGELARAILVDEVFLASRHDVLEDTAGALDRALAYRLEQEQQSASESEQAAVVLATVNSPCGAVEVPVTTEAPAATE